MARRPAKVHDPLGALRAALEHAARALVDGLVLEPHDGRPAYRAGRRHDDGPRIFRALIGQIARHFRDHVARAAHDHGVADHETLARDFVHVVQRRVAHGDAAHEHRLELGGRRQRAGAADVEDDVFEMVSSSSAGNLCASAQRGARDTNPSFSWSARLSTL